MVSTLMLLALAFADAPVVAHSDARAQSARIPCVERSWPMPPFDPGRRVEDLAAFDRADARMSAAELLDLLGPPKADIGSGLHVLVWEARDGRRLQVSAGDFCLPVIAFHRSGR